MKYNQFTSKERIAKYNTLRRKRNVGIIKILFIVYVILWLIALATYSEWSTSFESHTNPLFNWRLYTAPFVIVSVVALFFSWLLGSTEPLPQRPPEECGYDDGS